MRRYCCSDMTVDAWQLHFGGSVVLLLDARRGCPQSCHTRRQTPTWPLPFAPYFPIRHWSTHQGPRDLFSQIKNLTKCPIAPIPTRPTIAPYYPVFPTQHGQKDRYVAVLFCTSLPSNSFFSVSIHIPVGDWQSQSKPVVPSSVSPPRDPRSLDASLI